MSAFLVPAFGQELIRNGDFEDSLAFWNVTYNNVQGTWGAATSAAYDSDPDNEVCVYKAYRYSTRACQTIDVSSTRLRFAGSARLQALVGTTSGYHAYAAVSLEYLDSADTVLGRTMVIKKTPNCTLQNTATQRLIPVAGSEWVDYELDVEREIESLPGVNPNDIAGISVVLETYGNGSTG